MSGFDTAVANMGVKRTGATPAPSATPPKTESTMDQNDFLKLMTAQLKNQDPFEPVDNTQMVAQMAQFSSLAGISEMNDTLKAIAGRLGATSTGDALAWVGKTVLTEGEVAYPATDGTLQGTIEVDGAASDVKVSIEGMNGEILKTVSLGPQEAGGIDFAWDGSTDSGEPAGPGPFRIRVSAQGTEGGAVGSRALVWAPVTSVTLDAGGEPVLTLPGLGQVPVSAVRKIG